jgi:GDP-L-fucose synthase
VAVPRDARIYVAGHTGLVGSAILRALQQRQYTTLITRSYKDLDLRDRQAVWDFFAKERPEYVYLAAARVGGICANMTYPVEFIQDNLYIELNVISAAHAFGVKKLLFLGSSCIYPRLAAQPIKEEYLLSGDLEPTNRPYALAKIAGIELVNAYRRQYGARFISVMPTNLYGPGDNFDLQTSHVLPALIRRFHLARCLEDDDWDAITADLNRRPIQGIDASVPRERILELLSQNGITASGASDPRQVTVSVWGTGQVYREFLHVEDLADACLFLMDRYDDSVAINVGTGQDMTVAQLAGLIAQVVGFKGRIAFDTTKPDGMPRKLLDTSRINALGWRPNIALAEGIASTYRWYLADMVPDRSGLT